MNNEDEMLLNSLPDNVLIAIRKEIIDLLKVPISIFNDTERYELEKLLEFIEQKVRTENINDNVKISKNDIINATSYMKNISLIPDNVLNEIQDNIIAEQNEHIGIAIRLEALALPIVVLFAVGSLVVEGVTSLWKQGYN